MHVAGAVLSPSGQLDNLSASDEARSITAGCPADGLYPVVTRD
jgi:hypothetical protein